MILNYVISVFKNTRVRRGYTDTKKIHLYNMIYRFIKNRSWFPKKIYMKNLGPIILYTGSKLISFKANFISIFISIITRKSVTWYLYFLAIWSSFQCYEKKHKKEVQIFLLIFSHIHYDPVVQAYVRDSHLFRRCDIWEEINRKICTSFLCFFS